MLLVFKFKSEKLISFAEIVVYPVNSTGFAKSTVPAVFSKLPFAVILLAFGIEIPFWKIIFCDEAIPSFAKEIIPIVFIVGAFSKVIFFAKSKSNFVPSAF